MHTEHKALGERLRIARSGVSMTQEDAAKHLGMSRTTLVAIEGAQRRVKTEELVKFADLYKTSVGRLTAPDSVHVDLTAKFRRIEGKSQSAAASDAIALLGRLATGAIELEQAVNAQLRTDYPPPMRILASSYTQQAEDAALSLRNRLGIGLGKIGDLFSALELDLGLRIFARPLKDSQISGLYAYDPAIGACILVNANHPRRRRLQTLAHESGHFISDRSHADVLDDEPVPTSLEERFARRFGPAFLMPSPHIRSRFTQIIGTQRKFEVRELVLIAHQFDVTSEAMCRRLEELELLAEGTWASIRERGFHAKIEREILGDVEPPSRPPLVPTRLAYLASHALDQGILSEEQLSELLVIDRLDLRDALLPFSNMADDTRNAR